MVKIVVGLHPKLTDNIVRCLKQNHIYTILGFLQEDCHKITVITNLTLSETLNIRNYLLTQINSANSVDDIFSRHKRFETNIDGFDHMLDGGLPNASIIEICGLAGSGKTQLSVTLCINNAQKGFDSLYIDSKGDVTGMEIKNILESRMCSFEEMGTLMQKIFIARVWNMNELLQIFDQLKSKSMENLRLIIVDSLPALMFQYHGDQTKQGLTMLNKFVNIARFICDKYNITLVVNNIITRWVDTIGDVNSEINTNMEIIKEKKNRSLGKYWRHVPSIVIHLESGLEQGVKTLKATLIKSNNSQSGVICAMSLTNVGVT